MRLGRCVRTLLSVAVVAVLAVLGGGGAVRATAPVTRYHRVDLGTLGGDSSDALKINARGEVIGHSTLADGTYRSFLWRHGTMTDLGELWADDINDAGQIVGTITGSDAVSHGYLWDAGTLTPLGSLGTLSIPLAIGNGGDIVGWTDTPGGGPWVPFLWSHGKMRALPLMGVNDVNGRGEVVGIMAYGDGYHAAVWRAGTLTDLGALGDLSGAIAISDRGWVVGWASQGFTLHALVWHDGTTTDVGSLGGDTYLEAINDRGQAVGWSVAPDGTQHQVRWQGGRLTDLTTTALTGSDTVADINDTGVLAGYVLLGSGAHATAYHPRR